MNWPERAASCRSGSATADVSGGSSGQPGPGVPGGHGLVLRAGPVKRGLGGSRLRGTLTAGDASPARRWGCACRPTAAVFAPTELPGYCTSARSRSDSRWSTCRLRLLDALTPPTYSTLAACDLGRACLVQAAAGSAVTEPVGSATGLASASPLGCRCRPARRIRMGHLGGCLKRIRVNPLHPITLRAPLRTHRGGWRGWRQPWGCHADVQNSAAVHGWGRLGVVAAVRAGVAGQRRAARDAVGSGWPGRAVLTGRRAGAGAGFGRRSDDHRPVRAGRTAEHAAGLDADPVTGR